jgi:hypothetical protein
MENMEELKKFLLSFSIIKQKIKKVKEVQKMKETLLLATEILGAIGIADLVTAAVIYIYRKIKK